MSARTFLTLINNVRTLVQAITSSAGASDANKIIATNANGRLDESLMPIGIGADVKIIAASESLTAGNFVTIWNDAGTPKVRRADASMANTGGQAHGYVRASVTTGQSATVYFEGENDQLTGLTPGVTYALSHSTPGGVIAQTSASTTAGHILQILGVATSATSINTEIRDPILRA
jgi:hypothetical protein